jgi:transcriptional regulator with XRE-family HTH domain
MKTLAEFAGAMREAQKVRKLSINELAERAGLTRQAVRQILAAETAPRLTNAMAVASELGFELVLLPKEAAQAIGATAQPERRVLTDIERRLGLDATTLAKAPSQPRK